MVRRPFNVTNVVTALSLLLCVAAGVYWTGGPPWAGSYWTRYDAAGRVGYGASAESGGFRIGGLTTGPGQGEALDPWWHSGLSDRRNDGPQPVGGFRDFRTLAGFILYRSGHDLVGVPGNSINVRVVIVQVPYWFIMTATAVLPVRHAVLARRARARGRLGICPRCSYDLRASPERCPECGTPAPLQAGGEAGPRRNSSS